MALALTVYYADDIAHLNVIIYITIIKCTHSIHIFDLILHALHGTYDTYRSSPYCRQSRQ